MFSYNKYILKQQMTGGFDLTSLKQEMIKYMKGDSTIDDITNIIKLLPEQYYTLLLLIYNEETVTINNLDYPKNYIKFIKDMAVTHYSSISPLYNHYYCKNDTISVVSYNLFNSNCDDLKVLNDEIFHNKILCCQESLTAPVDEIYNYTIQSPEVAHVKYWEYVILINFDIGNINTIFIDTPNLIITANYENRYSLFKHHNKILLFGSGYNAVSIIIPKNKDNVTYNVTRIHGYTFKSLEGKERYSINFTYNRYNITNIHLDGGKYVDQHIMAYLTNGTNIISDTDTDVSYNNNILFILESKYEDILSLNDDDKRTYLSQIKSILTYILSIKCLPLKQAFTDKSHIILGDFNSIYCDSYQKFMTNTVYFDYMYGIYQENCKNYNKTSSDENFRKLFNYIYIINNFPYKYLEENGYIQPLKESNERNITSPIGETEVDMAWIKSSIVTDKTFCFTKEIGLTKFNKELKSRYDIGSKCTSDHYPIFLNVYTQPNLHKKIEFKYDIKKYDDYIQGLLRVNRNIAYRGSNKAIDSIYLGHDLYKKIIYKSKNSILCNSLYPKCSRIQHTMSTQECTPFISITSNLKQALYFSLGRSYIGDENTMFIIKTVNNISYFDPLKIVACLKKYVPTDNKLLIDLDNFIKRYIDSKNCLFNDKDLDDDYYNFETCISQILDYINNKNPKNELNAFYADLIKDQFIIDNDEEKNIDFLKRSLPIYINRSATQFEKLISDKIVIDHVIDYTSDSYDVEGRYLFDNHLDYRLLCDSWSYTQKSSNYMYILCNVAYYNKQLMLSSEQ